MEIREIIVEEIKNVITSVKKEEIDRITEIVDKDKRVFIVGEGRSGLQGKAFAMRLMHLGFTTFVVGETITPSMREGDVLFAISGSGSTQNVLNVAKKAKKFGVIVIGITSTEGTELTKEASEQLIIPGATKKGQGVKSIQLLSTLFDQSVHVTLDWLCLEISKKNKISNKDAVNQHSNIE